MFRANPVMVAFLAFLAFLPSITTVVHPDRLLEGFITSQIQVARQGVLSNIGGINGSNVPGIPDGVVVASPSKINPDYFYTWTRNAAITFQALVERFLYGTTWLEPIIKSYVESVNILQRIENPSGSFNSGGLGEPLFYPNQTAFLNPWPRPQRDGPALRASVLIDYGLSIYPEQQPYVSDILWPIIQADLNYLVGYWNMTGFDIWEESNGSSFYTIAVQHKALRKGFEFSSLFGIANSEYFDHSNLLLCFLGSFWSDDYILANLNIDNGRVGLDASTILASIHTFSPDLECDEKTFQPCSSRALANHKRVVDSFRTIYEINRAASPSSAVAIGRYPEDNYYGGNPWYSTTLAAAEQLYDALFVWRKLDQVNVTATSLDFFKVLLPNVRIGSYNSNSSTFTLIMTRIQAYADEFISIIRRFSPMLGPMHEQFSGVDGMSLSAADCTWSQVSFLSMDLRRRGLGPINWGNTLSLLPDENICQPMQEIPVDIILGNFNVNASVPQGAQVYLIGNIDELAKWAAQDAIKMIMSPEYNSTWTAVVSLPAETSFQYRYIIQTPDGKVEWETGFARSFTTPPSGNFAIHDTLKI